MKIKRFKLKHGHPTKEEIEKYRINSGGCWISQECTKWMCMPLNGEISLNIGFASDDKWNDFENILLLDENFCQPYVPFYNFMDGKRALFPYLAHIIEEYNRVMSELTFLEEI